MRRAAIILASLMVLGCNSQPESPSKQGAEQQRAPTNTVEVPVEPPAATDNEANDVTIPVEPPNHPALGELSPSRRREYERGYRDCRTGNYNYDPDRLGEYYRIGCMAAENARAGAEP